MERMTSKKHEVSEPEPGTLYVVSTPIGNLEDITQRALKILSRVNVVAAEDTRTTGHMLRHFGIDAFCVSCFSHNEAQRIPQIIRRLENGESAAVVSDAGTPAVSDPAARLISAVIEAGFKVVPVPGASAVLAALVVSGFQIDRFYFEGFLPQKKRRSTRLKELAAVQRTIVLYESPHRIRRTLRDLLAALGDRRISISRELTKVFEETRRGRISELIGHFEATEPRGEFVMVIDSLTPGVSPGTGEGSEELDS
jgi:16S rRNA (cytidine1402-2'-O)-methyltransferase